VGHGKDGTNLTHRGIKVSQKSRSSGFEPRQGQGFSSSYETPKLLGAGDFHVLRMRR
jgi:hypothetical protein